MRKDSRALLLSILIVLILVGVGLGSWVVVNFVTFVKNAGIAESDLVAESESQQKFIKQLQVEIDNEQDLESRAYLLLEQAWQMQRDVLGLEGWREQIVDNVVEADNILQSADSAAQAVWLFGVIGEDDLMQEYQVIYNKRAEEEGLNFSEGFTG